MSHLYPDVGTEMAVGRGVRRLDGGAMLGRELMAALTARSASYLKRQIQPSETNVSAI